MIKRILVSLVMMVALLITVSMAPANAGAACEVLGICGHVNVASNSSYGMLVTCNINAPGANSQWVPKGGNDKCHDMDGILIAGGTDLYCRANSRIDSYVLTATATGWYQVHDNFSRTCQARNQ